MLGPAEVLLSALGERNKLTADHRPNPQQSVGHCREKLG